MTNHNLIAFLQQFQGELQTAIDFFTTYVKQCQSSKAISINYSYTGRLSDEWSGRKISVSTQQECDAPNYYYGDLRVMSRLFSSKNKKSKSSSTSAGKSDAIFTSNVDTNTKLTAKEDVATTVQAEVQHDETQYHSDSAVLNIESLINNYKRNIPTLDKRRNKPLIPDKFAEHQPVTYMDYCVQGLYLNRKCTEVSQVSSPISDANLSFNYDLCNGIGVDTTL
ncbi:hypothetical protein PPYR_04612 [Photinus pyralis]|uniref:Uncharacterized protein n=1 Tax=Photinus pyralis TaxID=7054 RepID=A0A5N4AYM8_PHOPY|nr:uncharacterized protein LOC116163941 [Photinus pyralis]KAB0802426.1 hypothetical protein PPYR_04612 [Photinus pyralis]